MKGSDFSIIEALHGDAPFGTVLDAGTGLRSLKWLTSLQTEACTAVTATTAMAARIKRLLGDRLREQDRLVVGNWSDPTFLAGEQFDTVFADHLLGAVEGFAPYFQSSLFPRLRETTLKRLYVIGMQPYVVSKPKDADGALIWEIGRFRDACHLLTGQLPYREFPLDWVIAELRRSGFEPIHSRKARVGYEAYFVNSQIDLALGGLEKMADQSLTRSLRAHGETLRARGLDHVQSQGPLKHTHYVIAADPI